MANVTVEKDIIWIFSWKTQIVALCQTILGPENHYISNNRGIQRHCFGMFSKLVQLSIVTVTRSIRIGLPVITSIWAHNLNHASSLSTLHPSQSYTVISLSVHILCFSPPPPISPYYIFASPLSLFLSAPAHSLSPSLRPLTLFLLYSNPLSLLSPLLFFILSLTPLASLFYFFSHLSPF